MFRVLFPFCFLILFSSFSFAQISVTGSSIAPVGTQWTYHTDIAMNPIVIPSGGPNQTWNEPNHSFGFHTASAFENPSTTPYDTAFPTATHCVNINGTYAYFQLTGNEYRQLGAVSGSILHYDPAALIMPIPITYPHSSWSRVFEYSYQVIPGFVAAIRDSSTIELDGWGTLTTQYGTFQVLRTLERHRIAESVNGGTPTIKYSTSYAWFNEQGITILSYTNPSDSVNFTTATITEAEITSTSVNPIGNIPEDFHLSQNYPNPFNPSTTIEFSLPEHEFVELEIVNILGEEITTLVSEELDAGIYKVQWDAAEYPSGVYLAHIHAGDFSKSMKLVLEK